MDLAALKVFLAVAQERSFSRAAAKVHRTQPAVSQAVRRLEVELGEQLFDRSSKTNVGELCLKYGGGGHNAAGTCQVPNDQSDKTLKDLIEKINKDG